MLSSKKLYYSIREVCEITGLEPHVLRYWESEFSILRPKKNRAGNRAYRDKDIETVKKIKHLLYDEQFTIPGARKKLAEKNPIPADDTESTDTEISNSLIETNPEPDTSPITVDIPPESQTAPPAPEVTIDESKIIRDGGLAVAQISLFDTLTPQSPLSDTSKQIVKSSIDDLREVLSLFNQ